MKIWASRFAGRPPRPRAIRHQFVIGPLCECAALQQKARLYYCMRCQWSFLVSGGRVAVLDEDGRVLGGSESRRRFMTFEEGPCPALEALASAASFNLSASKPRFSQESAAVPDYPTPSQFHTQSGCRRPALEVVSRMVKL